MMPLGLIVSATVCVAVLLLADVAILLGGLA